MEVIALHGPSNKGKSETLNIVYQLMLLYGYTQVPGHFRILGNPVQKDFIDILEKDGKCYGIATMGDYARKPNECVKDLLHYLNSQGCHKAICACNDNLLGTVNAVKAYAHTLYPKTNVTPHEHLYRIINHQDALHIYSLL